MDYSGDALGGQNAQAIIAALGAGGQQNQPDPLAVPQPIQDGSFGHDLMTPSASGLDNQNQQNVDSQQNPYYEQGLQQTLGQQPRLAPPPGINPFIPSAPVNWGYNG